MMAVGPVKAKSAAKPDGAERTAADLKSEVKKLRANLSRVSEAYRYSTDAVARWQKKAAMQEAIILAFGELEIKRAIERRNRQLNMSEILDSEIPF